MSFIGLQASVLVLYFSNDVNRNHYELEKRQCYERAINQHSRHQF